VILFPESFVSGSVGVPPTIKEDVCAISLIAIYVAKRLESALDSEAHTTLQLPFIGKDDLLTFDLRPCGERKILERLRRHRCRLPARIGDRSG